MYCILVYTERDLHSTSVKLAEDINNILDKYGHYYTPDTISNVRYISMEKDYIEELKKDLIGIESLLHFVISPLIKKGKCNGVLYFGEWEHINAITGK